MPQKVTPNNPGPFEYLGTNDWNKNVYYLYVGDDRFVHFTTQRRAQEILQSGKLMIDSPYDSMGAYGVFAVSLLYGEYYPSVTTKHVEKTSLQENSPVVAVEFSTNTVPRKSGHPDETAFGEQDVRLQGAKIIRLEEAIQKIRRAPYAISDDDYIIYDKNIVASEKLVDKRGPNMGKNSALRVVLTWLGRHAAEETPAPE